MSVLLFQAVRELLVNVVKHAGASKVRVGTRSDGGELIIDVRDDGIGFNPEGLALKVDRDGGYGLFSIHERLSSVGGRMHIDAHRGRGTLVSLSVPLGARAGSS